MSFSGVPEDGSNDQGGAAWASCEKKGSESTAPMQRERRNFMAGLLMINDLKAGRTSLDQAA